jgi:hypothetical protein
VVVDFLYPVSNYLAVATVTATLQRMLQSVVQIDVDGARVTTVQPGQIGRGTPETGINLFLYQVSRNPALKNSDMLSGRSKGNPVKRQSVIDLYYIISFYGNEGELEPQRLLGSVIRTFSDRSTLTADAIQETIADSRFRFLAESDLAEQVQQVLINPTDLSLDDLSKVWSTFFQAPYLLSITYKITMVTIEGEESLRKALPVRDRSFGGIAPFPYQPVVDRVVSEAGLLEPILTTSTLLISGKQLQGQTTQVRIAGFDFTPTTVSDTQITLCLPTLSIDGLRAGVQGVQVIHRRSRSTVYTDPSGRHPSDQQVVSNAMPMVLRPTIQHIQVANIQGQGDDLRSATLIVEVDVMVGIKQRVVLVLNEWSVNNPVGYQFEANLRQVDTTAIEVSVYGVKPSEYLVRLQIDGAESLLSIDSDPSSPTVNWYASPRVSID